MRNFITFSTLFFVISLVLVNQSLSAQEYFVDSKSRQTKLSCQIAEALIESLDETTPTIEKKMKFFMKHTRSEFKPWAKALGMHVEYFGITLFTDYDYLLPGALILDGYQTVDLFGLPNYFGAYSYYANKMEIDYRFKEIPTYKTSEQENILEISELFFPMVKAYRLTPYLNAEGKEKSYKYNCKKDDKDKDEQCEKISVFNVGDSSHPHFAGFVENILVAEHMASPLFVWIVEQPKKSISPEKLFQKANEIYNDPWVALGAINIIMLIEAHTGSRQRADLVASRLEPIINDRDLPGHNYHLWGYMLHAMSGLTQGIYYKFWAWVHEHIYQWDPKDWEVDEASFYIGESIVRSQHNDKICRN